VFARQSTPFTPPPGAAGALPPPPGADGTLPSSPHAGEASPKGSSSRPGCRAARVLAWLLVAAGVLALADVGVTLVWQEPLSALYAQLRQESLRRDLRVLDRSQPSPAAQLELRRLGDERRRIAYLAAVLRRHARAGSAVGRIVIPRIGADFVVVKGTGTSELRDGPGIYRQTPFPGVSGTSAIAGHRTTYLAPFRHIDSLRRGNRILLAMPYGRFTYRVTGVRVVEPSDTWVIDPVGYSRLVLSACTPLFSASHRIVVFARLESIQPLGAARVPGLPAAQLRFAMPAGHGSGTTGRPWRRGGRGFTMEGGEDEGLPQVLEPLQRLPLSLVS
jgi:sortase A